jgi:NAD(P)H-dependent flavin oxidoreductase YrpB (nitropropane dioxygenase family)
VGLPANAIRTPLVEKYFALDSSIKPTSCDGCLKKCGKQFCILEALTAARNGDYERGLFFTGKRFADITSVEPVRKIFADLLSDTQAYLDRVFDKSAPAGS